MKYFSYVLSVMTIITVLCCCSSSKNSINTLGVYGVSVSKAQIIKPDTLNYIQIDSVMRVDALPVLDKWTTSTFKDEESGTMMSYKTLFDKSTNIVYTIKILDNNTFVLSKKVVQVR